jgi:hypothetical protein
MCWVGPAVCAPAVVQSHALCGLYRWSKLFWASPWITQLVGLHGRAVIILPLVQTWAGAQQQS